MTQVLSFWMLGWNAVPYHTNSRWERPGYCSSEEDDTGGNWLPPKSEQTGCAQQCGFTHVYCVDCILKLRAVVEHPAKTANADSTWSLESTTACSEALETKVGSGASSPLILSGSKRPSVEASVSTSCSTSSSLPCSFSNRWSWKTSKSHWIYSVMYLCNCVCVCVCVCEVRVHVGKSEGYSELCKSNALLNKFVCCCNVSWKVLWVSHVYMYHRGIQHIKNTFIIIINHH